ncbi:MAG: type II toxin-antitoxin system HicB family antitoxin [Symploca sp. SIO2E9]|nr:type II toxin-antitoxin system HicB family antitoxin [Symploca sp. SIO2E9]
MLINWSDEDQTFVVTFPEFGSCQTHGDSYQEAVKNATEVLKLLVETYKEQGKALPEPLKLDKQVV